MTDTCAVPQLQAQQAAMSDREFERLSGIISAEFGIHLSPVKKVMLTVRLARRLKALGMTTFAEYLKYVESPNGRASELAGMIDAVSTNKTDFYREADHFNYLVRVALPLLDGGQGRPRSNGVRVWSAGCATGEEAYTIAMTLSEYRETRPGFRFSIMASDISGDALDSAIRGVYPEHTVGPVPAHLRRKYLMRGTGRLAGFYRIAPELRRIISFRVHNLSEREFGFSEKFDVIFCRNVIIYLERKVQENLFRNFHKSLSPGGYLFVGHSETLDGISDSFVRVAPTIYRRS
ncbi:MAG: protein-glutamate O-methyltransferase [Nitrospirae bacterium]|nr:protein-glutamate O-methyltransferase [Nitrospirota bacterium]